MTTPPIKAPGPLLHAEPCPLSKPESWAVASWQNVDAHWEPLLPCTCPPDGVDAERERVVAEAFTGQTPEGLIAAGGWRAPHEVAYPLFGEITARRGGVQFTAPRDALEEKTKEELIDLILRERADYQRNSRLARRRIGKLREKNNRLLRLVGKLA